MNDDSKRNAALAALNEVSEGSVVGLGSGSTATLFIEELGKRVRAGFRIVGVPTSEATRSLALRAGIPLLDDDGPWAIDVNVDGADEVSATLDLIKGGGGAHAREKIVSYAAKRNVIVVDSTKLSTRLGERWAVPIEVLPFAHRTTHAHLSRLGQPALRMRADAPIRTDAGNLIYDLTMGPIDDPAGLDCELHAIPGVVETGLFIRRADLVLVANGEDLRRLER